MVQKKTEICCHKWPKASTQTRSPYGIDCNRVDGCDIDKCNLVWVICHVESVRIGGWGECKRGGVGASMYDGGGSVSWQVDRGVVDEGGVIGGACDPGCGGGGEHVPGR